MRRNNGRREERRGEQVGKREVGGHKRKNEDIQKVSTLVQSADENWQFCCLHSCD